MEDVNWELKEYPQHPARLLFPHALCCQALFLVGFIFPTLQMKKLKDRTKSLVESDSPCLWTWSTRATAGRSAPVTSPVPFLLISLI